MAGIGDADESPMEEAYTHVVQRREVRQKSSLFMDFRKEIWRTDGRALETGPMQSIWGRKVELALRTGFSAMLTSIYAVLPAVQHAHWQSATVFAPVTGICAVSGPNLGDTLHHSTEFVKGSILGALVSTFVNELFRPIGDEGTRKMLSWGFFILATLFLTSRPGQPLAQKRFAVGVMLCGTVNMSVKAHVPSWWLPWKVAVPCCVGPATALLALLLPRPRLATAELRQRLVFQALAQRALVAEQFEGFFHTEVGAVASADQLLETIRDNCQKMKELVHAVEWECLGPAGCQRLSGTVSFFEEQLSMFRMIELTLRRAPSDTSTATEKFMQITEPCWRAALKALVSVTDDIVVAEKEDRPVSFELVDALEASRKSLLDACERARKEVVYRGGSQYEALASGENRPVNHCRRIARHFFADRLLACTVSFGRTGTLLSLMPQRETLDKSPTLRERCAEFWSWPQPKLWKDAIKKTLSMAILSLIAWVPALRERSPQFIWAFIAAAFVMSDYAGTSISTGLGRVFGTLLGGMFGYACMNFLMEWELPLDVDRACYAGLLTLWATVCCLFKSSPRHGYLATVTAFSAAIMVVGALEQDADKEAAEEVVLHRTHMQFIGAAVYVLVEVLVWPMAAREVVNGHQTTILRLIQHGLAEALAPWDLESDGEERTATGASSDDASSDSSEDTMCSPSKSKVSALRKGVAAVAEGLASAKAAGGEPSMWLKDFPLGKHERVLHSQSRALGIAAALHASSRACPPAEVDPDVPPLIAGFARAATAALEAAAEDVSVLMQGQPYPRGLRTQSVRELLSHTADTTSSASVASHLLALNEADRLLRLGMEKHAQRFVDHDPYPNSTSFSVQTTLFLCLRFTKVMEELAERLRLVESAETSFVNI